MRGSAFTRFRPVKMNGCGPGVMSFFIETRALIPSHLFRSSVLAWQCSLCHAMFCIPLEEAEERDEITPPDYVEHEFQVHNCVMVLVERGEVRRGRSPSHSSLRMP